MRTQRLVFCSAGRLEVFELGQRQITQIWTGVVELRYCEVKMSATPGRQAEFLCRSMRNSGGDARAGMLVLLEAKVLSENGSLEQAAILRSKTQRTDLSTTP